MPLLLRGLEICTVATKSSNGKRTTRQDEIFFGDKVMHFINSGIYIRVDNLPFTVYSKYSFALISG